MLWIFVAVRACDCGSNPIGRSHDDQIQKNAAISFWDERIPRVARYVYFITKGSTKICFKLWSQTDFVSLVVVLFSPMLEDARELQVVEHAVLVDRRLPEHLVNVLVGEAISHAGEQLPQALLVDAAHIVLVEAGKGVLDDVLWVGALQPVPEQRQEHGEVDGAGSLVHHALQVRVLGVLAQRREHVVEVLFADESVPVLINHVESLLELLDLRLVEHGEDIGRRALGALLGRAPPFGLAARHAVLAAGASASEETKKKKTAQVGRRTLH